MSKEISLKEAERKVFTTATQDGLWDIFIGCFLLMFSIAPYLSSSLGDFWSSVIFVPFWGMIILAIWLIRRYVLAPRMGIVKYGEAQKRRLHTFGVVMLTVNIIAFVLGIWASISYGYISGRTLTAIFGLICLTGFSCAAYILELRRLYIYGLLVGFSPIIGEWLWAKGLASHHGFPITFGITSSVIILTGLVIFIRILRNNPIPIEGISSEEV